MSKRISLLGSTGSIGRQTLDVIDACGMEVAAITANSSVDRLEEQARRYHPELAVLMDEKAADDLKVRLADTPVKVLSGMDGLLEAARTRRYPLARLRRMLLAAYLELPEPEHIPYLRLLAASSRGCDLLRQMRGAPVLTKPADVSHLGQTAQDLFTREAGWTDLYTLAYPDLSQSACGADWRATPWIM